MRPFLVCIHDASPAHVRETERIIRDLAPLVGRRLSLGVVPNWRGEWPLTEHAEYCRMIQDASEELLLHGYFHRRQRGWGAASLLAERCDEMNGLDREETRLIVARGQQMFRDVFGRAALGFLAPGWQPGHVRRLDATVGVQHTLGFFSLDTRTTLHVPLATWTWDCGRWSWLGYIGHEIGRLLQRLAGRVPVLAIHPRDLERGFWPRILRLTHDLLDAGFMPSTPAGLLEARGC